MELKKKERASLRSAVMRGINYIENLLTEKTSDIDTIQAGYNVVNVRFDSLLMADRKVFEDLLEMNATEKELDEELGACDEYARTFERIKRRYTNFINISEKDFCKVSEIQTENISICTKRKFKLPNIEFKKFSGDIKGWLPFWNQFRKIHEDKQIDSADKIQYLFQATLPDSPARRIVESFPAIDKNYIKVINKLKSRYGREDLQVEVYVRELIKLVIQRVVSKSTFNIASVYDRIETQLRALETLGVTTDKCVSILFPLIESCLPEDLLRIWQRSPYCKKEFNDRSLNNINLAESDTEEEGPQDVEKVENRLENLLLFLKNEVENEQRVSLATEGFGLANVGDKNNSKLKTKNHEIMQIPTATGLVNYEASKCIFCNGNHLSLNCFIAHKMSFEKKKEIIIKNKACFGCLKIGHISKKCKEFVKCNLCGKSHPTLLCFSLTRNVVNKTEKQNTAHKTAAKEIQTDSNLANYTNGHVFLQTLNVVVSGPCGFKRVRALIDNASQHSYILKSTVSFLGIEPKTTERVVHALFGGINTSVKEHKIYDVIIKGHNNFSKKFKMMDEDIICSSPARRFHGPWIEELKGKSVKVDDDGCGPIEVLFGADVCATLETGRRFVLNCGLIAIETVFGWTLIGKVNDTFPTLSMAATSISCIVESVSLEKLWELDTLGIKDPYEKNSKDEILLATKNYFLSTIEVDSEGRYQIRLPWVEGHSPLPDNFFLAKKRLEKTLEKLRQQNMINDYENVFNEWLQEGIIEEVIDKNTVAQCHYLPHRPVIKEDSTTRIRPVFDASAHEKGSPSLNNCLEKGMNLIENIPNMLLRFRMKRLGVVSDIRKAFLQISVHPSERDVLRFLWTDSKGNVKLFRHKRVVFGVTSSPYLLGATIEYHLSRCMDVSDECEDRYGRETVERLAKSFYVDNCITSLDDESELLQFIREATELMADGKFELRGWEYTGNPPNSGANSISVLGLKWDPVRDIMFLNQIITPEYKIDALTEPEQVFTKRNILSAVSRVFDPIGYTCPAMVVPKLLLQRTWQEKVGWDSPLGEEVRDEFKNWVKDLPRLASIEITRWIGSGRACRRPSLHTFCDASKDAYAAVIFLRVEREDEVIVSLIGARARIAPLKRPSIPRLELLAATIGARLFNSMKSSFDELIDCYFWTDSSTVITWIKEKEEWSTFVWNRVQQIRLLTSLDSWRHIPGAQNPADLPSRGCSPSQLLATKWWEGPRWLYDCQINWPSAEVDYDEIKIDKERKKTSITVANVGAADWHLYYFSKYTKIVRMMAWIFRYVFNLKKGVVRRTGVLTVKEIDQAEKFVIKVIQAEVFVSKNFVIGGCVPLYDEEGILRVKSRILKRDDTKDFKMPIVLPANHEVVKSLIRYFHESLCHVGTQGLLAALRERFWVIGGRRTVRSVIRKCITCQRHNSKLCEVAPTVLPNVRVRDAKVFEVIGVDFAGPLFLKGGEKTWICLFTCSVYRAVHLELATSLSTSCFIQALRRFIAKRGRPKIIYSDNGTNFVGTDNLFSKLDWEGIADYSSTQRIQWRFNPPSAPWWGGFWERLIGVLKQLLRKVLGRASLSYEELLTIVCDCEAVINSRPLSYLSEDATDLVPLTPSMFLRDLEETGVPDCDAVDRMSLERRVRYRISVMNALRKRFRNEYLGQLKILQSCKRSSIRPMKIGDVVLLSNEVNKRLDWPMGRVVELIPGKDGETRLVRVETARGRVLRPVQRLLHLEVNDSSSPSDNQLQSKDNADVIKKCESTGFMDTSSIKSRTPVMVSRSGRILRKPERFPLS